MFKFILSGLLVASFVLQGALAQKGKLTLKPDPILSKAVVQFMDKETVGSLIDRMKVSLTDEDITFLKKTYQKQSRLILSADLRDDKVFINGEEVLTVFEDRRMSLRGRLFAYNPELGVEENSRNLDRVLKGTKTSLVDLFLPRADALAWFPALLVAVVVGGGGYQMFFSKDEQDEVGVLQDVHCLGDGPDYVVINENKKKKGEVIRTVMTPSQAKLAVLGFAGEDCNNISVEGLRLKIANSSNYKKQVLDQLQGRPNVNGREKREPEEPGQGTR